MKVFLFFKDDNKTKDQEVIQSADKELELQKVKIEEKTCVKNLIISNPKQSSSIYIIHGLRLSNKSKVYKDSNEVLLYCNNYMNHCSAIERDNTNTMDSMDNLKVSASGCEEKRDNSMHLKNIKLKDEENMELLKDEFVIILPGGELGVEFNNELDEINGEIKIEKRSL